MIAHKCSPQFLAIIGAVKICMSRIEHLTPLTSSCAIIYVCIGTLVSKQAAHPTHNSRLSDPMQKRTVPTGRSHALGCIKFVFLCCQAFAHWNWLLTRNRFQTIKPNEFWILLWLMPRQLNWLSNIQKLSNGALSKSCRVVI